jgi:hypothetical protein
MDDELPRLSRLQIAGLALAVVGPQLTGIGHPFEGVQPFLVFGSAAAGTAMIWAGRGPSGIGAQLAGTILVFVGALTFGLTTYYRVLTAEPFGVFLGPAALAAGLWLFRNRPSLSPGQLVGVPLSALAIEGLWYGIFYGIGHDGAFFQTNAPTVFELLALLLGARLCLQPGRQWNRTLRVVAGVAAAVTVIGIVQVVTRRALGSFVGIEAAILGVILLSRPSSLTLGRVAGALLVALTFEWIWYQVLSHQPSRGPAKVLLSTIVAAALVALGLKIFRRQAGAFGRTLLPE